MSRTKLSEKLKELRTDHDYTQEDLGKYLNISRQGYAHYENGGRTPDYQMLIKISKFYDVSLDYILSDSDIDIEELKQKSSPFSNYHTLSKREKKLLYLFSNLSIEEQDDLLIYLHIKNKRNEKQNSKKTISSKSNKNDSSFNIDQTNYNKNTSSKK